ncbi:MAG: cobalt-precorrin-6A reductase [Pseudonocardia sp.]
MHLLILGGTGEARRLAAALAGTPGLRVTTSLAGRVAVPALPDSDVRIGGFGGVEGLCGWLRAHSVGAVVDATHPFAARMTAHAAAATARLAMPLLVLRRPGWGARATPEWTWVGSLAEAAAALPGLGSRVFLTTGRVELAAFAHLHDLWFLARSVDPPVPPVPPCLHVLLDRGPFTVAGETALLREHRIDVLVTKDSGGDMTGAKLDAAAALRIPVVVQARPPLPPGVDSVATVEDAARWVLALPAGAG